MSRARTATAVGTVSAAPRTAPLAISELAPRWFRAAAALAVAWLRRPEASADEVARLLADADAPAAQHAWEKTDAARREQRAAVAELRAQLLAGRAGQLAATFALDDGEQELLLAALAVQCDPGLLPLCAWLNGHTTAAWVSGQVAARLRTVGRNDEPGPSSALRKWRLLLALETPAGLAPGWRLDEPIARWLMGHDEVDPLLAPHLRPHDAEPPPSGWSLAPLVEALRQRLPTPSVVAVHGEPGSGQAALAAMIAGHLGLLCWEVAPAADAPPWRELWLRANRFAFLTGCALAWRAPVQLPPTDLAPFPLRFLLTDDSTTPWSVDAAITAQPLTPDDRAALWPQRLPTLKAWKAPERQALLNEPIGYDELRQVAAAGPTSLAAARARLSTLRHADAGGLVASLPLPFTWDDLVLPAGLLQRLRELSQEIGDQVGFFARPEAARLFPRGRGLHVLLGGPPGTGKTMATQVLAWATGRPLWRVDLAQVADKYVGESEKRLARVFSAARRSGAMLLFDEADALFARRGEVREARDRWANLEAAYLLQALEDHPGPVVLATNRSEDIDSAFARRLRSVLPFPAPDVPHRLLMWQRLVLALTTPEIWKELEPELERLARELPLTPAQIKQAVLSGCLAARRGDGRLTLDALLAGVERELLKAGSAFSSRDRERLGGAP